jgi:8-oxo-dGTP pyrophosphatase MutT (NUDIX family)
MIRAAGAVLWMLDGGRPLVAVVHRPRYDDWSLPKGKLHEGEDAAAGAVREVFEETGHSLVLGRRLGEISYVVSPGTAKHYGPKTVEYWAARAIGGQFASNDEVDQLRWMRPEQATRRLSYPWDRTVLNRFIALPADTSTVLLVRHAKAGDREEWNDDDRLRPLTNAGQRQAKELRQWLQLFSPRRVYSAPRVRCVDTVLELAEDLGVDVITDERLAEEGYWNDPAATRARLLEIASGDGPAVVCSQGGAIPNIVERLASRSGLDVRHEIVSRKASTWVLSLYGERLVAADYYPPP